MTKLNIGQLFEISQLQALRDVQVITPFVDFVNSMADNLVRVLRNGVGLRDNVDCEIFAITMTDGIAQKIKTRKTPIGVIVIRQALTQQQIKNFTWLIASDGSTQVTVSFESSFSTEVTFLAFFS